MIEHSEHIVESKVVASILVTIISGSASFIETLDPIVDISIKIIAGIGGVFSTLYLIQKYKNERKRGSMLDSYMENDE